MNHIGKSIASRSMEEINPLYLAIVRQDLECCISFVPLSTRQTWTHWSKSIRVQPRWPEAGAVMQRLQELGVFSHRSRRLPGFLTLVFGYLMEGNTEERARLFSEACTKERKTSMSCNTGNFFTVRVVSPWSRLPREAGKSSSLEIFKASLDMALL